MEKLVSIVAACYNGERYIANFLEAILEQTYPEIQLIIVDDGSSDNTVDILEAYSEKFIKRRIEYLIVRKENGGQASAINAGLLYVKGEYITWPDTDDFLYPESIKKRVDFLSRNVQYGMVLSNGDEYDLESLKKVRTSVVKKVQAKDLLNQVLDMTAMFNNNGYLVRSEILWKAYPERKIYENRAGQNIQILLPLATLCKCGYIDESLYGRTIRYDSHSKGQTNAQLRRKQINEVYYHTIAKLNERQSYAAVRYGLYDLYSRAVSFTEEDAERNWHDLKSLTKKCLKTYFKAVLRRIKKVVN